MKSTIYCFLLMSIAIIIFIALRIIDLSVSFAQGKSKIPAPQKQVSIPLPSEVIMMNQHQNYQPSSHEPPVAPLTEEEIGKHNELIGRIDRDIIISDLKFSFDIFSGAVKQNDKPNTFISPFSVMQALLLTHNGAAGETKTAIAADRALLQLDPPNPATVNFHLAQLLHRDNDPAARLHVLKALEDAPRYREALRLLLALGATPSESNQVTNLPAPARQTVAYAATPAAAADL